MGPHPESSRRLPVGTLGCHGLAAARANGNGRGAEVVAGRPARVDAASRTGWSAVDPDERDEVIAMIAQLSLRAVRHVLEPKEDDDE